MANVSIPMQEFLTSSSPFTQYFRLIFFHIGNNYYCDNLADESFSNLLVWYLSNGFQQH